jgi:predicted ATPase
MKIKVIGYTSKEIGYEVENPEFLLMRDSWNDDNYYTYYSLYTNLIKSGKYTIIGGVRILKKEQQRNETFLIPKGIIVEPLEGFCSLGTSLDYYERISQLDYVYKDYILNFLNDIIYKPSLQNIFKEEEGFNSSLLRNITLEDDIFDLAPIIITGIYKDLPVKKELKFEFQTNQMLEPILFDFSSVHYYKSGQEQSLPNRICVIIGRNGSGKSTLLSKIARLVFSSADDRIYIKDLATIEPKGLGFSRIINISYSAFDSFQVPGITPSEKRQIAEEMDENKGRYFYCGVRDIKREVLEELDKLKIDALGKIQLEDILNDKYNFNYLKSLSTLNDEFHFSLGKILENEEKTSLLISSLSTLSQESSLHFLSVVNLDVLKNNSLLDNSFFTKLSTGHKFVIHSIFKLIYHIQRRSLVLFDEPESHLHPPLLAILMKTLRNIMDSQSSFMIIATHSPVVIQETLQKHVIIIRREGKLIKTNIAENQTYGESIGALTSDVFGLAADYKDYHEELNKIVDSYDGKEELFESYIMGIFELKISLQAYAYMISRYQKNRLYL